MTEDRVHLTAAEAQALALRALGAIGYDAEESRILAGHMLDAAYCGYEYSGLPKILQIARSPRAKEPRTPMRALHETPLSALYDGGNTCGMITLHHAAKAAIEKARPHGISIIGVTNCWNSGRSAYYVEMIARADLVGLHTVGAASQVAPPGARRPALGTNPIAFGFPMAGDPLLIDVGTSAFPGTEIDMLAILGGEIPAGVAMDEAGMPTRDAARAKRGAIHPYGGHKGYALALAMQACAVLGGSALGATKEYGYLLVAIRPDLLLPLEDFKRELAELLERVRATPRQPGVEKIRIPSENAFRNRARALSEGIEIDRRIHDALLAL